MYTKRFKKSSNRNEIPPALKRASCFHPQRAENGNDKEGQERRERQAEHDQNGQRPVQNIRVQGDNPENRRQTRHHDRAGAAQARAENRGGRAVPVSYLPIDLIQK